MIERILQDMIEYNGDDSRRINHAIKVYQFCCLIMEEERLTEDERFILKAAAILHDIGIHNCEKKYQSSSGRYQEMEGPPVAGKILEKYDIPVASFDRILFLISKHHSYREVDGLDFQILIEADFIVNADEERYSESQKKMVAKKYFKTETGLNLISSVNE